MGFFKKVFGGIFGKDDPVAVLERSLIEMEAHIPRLNENITLSKAEMKKQESRLAAREQEAAKLEARIKELLAQGKRDEALPLAAQYESLENEIELLRTQAAESRKNYQASLDTKEMFLREQTRKKQEIEAALAQARRNKEQKKLADALETFEGHGHGRELGRALDSIQQESTENKVRMELSQDQSRLSDPTMQDRLEKLRADQLLKKFESEIGKKPEEKSEKQMGPGQPKKNM